MRFVLELSNVTYGTPEGRVLQRGLNLGLDVGEMLLITGSNGCGKSTLLKALLGQFPLLEGSISRQVADDELQYIPQLENTEVHLPLTLWDVLSISRPGRLTVEDVTKFGLLKAEQLDSAWNTASGGERKRTMLTRALLRNPSMLVFDEPMNHLDTESRRAMISVMARFLSADSGRVIVMVSHLGLEEDERPLFRVKHLNLDAGRARA